MKISFLGLSLAVRKFIKELKEDGSLNAFCSFISYEEFDASADQIEEGTDLFVFCTNDVFYKKKDYYLGFIKKYSSKLRKEVILFAESDSRYQEMTFYAIRKGAIDYVKIPEKLDLYSKKSFQEKCLDVFAFIELYQKNGATRRNEHIEADIEESLIHKIDDPVVCIGVSTGGPKILTELFSLHPGKFDYPIVIAQHMPENYTAGFIDFMKNSFDLDFVPVHNGDRLENGKVYIVPGGQHVAVTERKRFKFEKNDRINALYRPSIDLLFSTAGSVFMENCIGILLTGIGEDGVQGLRKIKTCGGLTVVQDKETSVVFGMPQAAIREKVADKVLPIAAIGRLLNKIN